MAVRARFVWHTCPGTNDADGADVVELGFSKPRRVAFLSLQSMQSRCLDSHLLHSSSLLMFEKAPLATSPWQLP